MREDIYQKKALFHSRIQTFLMLCFLVVIIAGGLAVKRGFTTVKHTVSAMEEKLGALDTAQIRDTVSALSGVTAQLGELDLSGINETVLALNNAAQTMGGVDVETLNSAIFSLKEAGTTLKSMDVDALNTVVEALETAVTNLQNAVNAITSIFG